MPAASLDQFGDTAASEVAKRGVGWKSSRSPRPFRIPVDLITRLNVMYKVAGAVGDGLAVRLTISDECVAAVEGNIQPLVTIHRP